MRDPEPAWTLRALVDELAVITKAASRLQDDDVELPQVQAVRDQYYEWYGQALNVVPASLETKFRDFFEGGQFTPRIRDYLSNPKAPNPLYDPTKATNPISASRFQYSFARAFGSNADAQKQILIEASQRVTKTGRVTPTDGDIFIVHGHNDGLLMTVARTVRALTAREPVILREQPSQGRTIIEKFEAHAATCSFAIGLLTADDFGRSISEAEDRPRARQNVVFEAGYFVGLVGRNRVALLHEPGVDLPSDLSGVVYVSLAGTWQLELARELRAAGIDADLNRLS